MTGDGIFAWDATQYLQFASHRLRPAMELLARIHHDRPQQVYDLGCGTGDIARLMAQRWPDAQVVGLDTSADMLEKAAEIPSPVRWVQGDVADWAPAQPVDVIYANAVFHWLADHETLFPRLVGMLAPGGVLAVQMPLSWGEASHRAMLEVLEELDLGSTDLRQIYRKRPVLAAATYIQMLQPIVSQLDVWETRYHQILEGDDPVVEWVRGTGLRPIIEALPPDALSRFLDRYRQVIRDAYPPQASGATVYPFPRLFIVATA